jgi:diguanylate cyclase (GGDEF)-like protein
MEYILSASLVILAIVILNFYIMSKDYKNIKGIYPFRLLTIAFLFHTVGYAFELISKDLNNMLIMLKVENIGIAFISFLFLWFVSEYAGEKKIINKKSLILVLMFNVATLIIVFTNEFHNLYYVNPTISNIYSFPVFSYERGIWYILHGFLMLFSVFYALIVIGLKYIRTAKNHRNRVGLVWLGFLMPIISFLYYAFELGPTYIDIAPFSYAILYFLVIGGLVKYKNLFVSSISYDVIMDTIDECIIVVDDEGIVVSKNEASKNYFDEIKGIESGDTIDEYPIIQGIINLDFQNPIKVDDRYYKFKMNNSGDSYGKVIVFSDVTEFVLAEKKLLTLSMTDNLTNLYNRRYFSDKLIENEKSGYVALIDLDDFKVINDTYGHNIGDEVLKYMGSLMNEILADGNPSRYGGEEFAVFFTDYDKDTVIELLDELRTEFSNQKFDFKTTLSVGVSEIIIGDYNNTMNRVDNLLYEAKKNGKNRIVFG